MVIEQREKVQMMGYFDSGDIRDVAVCSSGELIVCSGLYVTADVEIIASSGLYVNISGQHVYVESGVYLASGMYVVTAGASGTYQASGVGVQIQSGIHIEQVDVLYSGNVDATVSSGVFGTAALHCSDTIVTADLVKVIGGSSGTYLAASSGGVSICVSGYWCSGPVHTVTVKNMDGNEDMFLGGVDCKPFSGRGFIIGGNEEHTFDVCNPCDIYACAVISGEMITWIGTDY